MNATLQYFPAQKIAEALGVSRKTIHRQADALRWPKELSGNRFNYCVPDEIAARVAVVSAALENKGGEFHGSAEHLPAVTFADIAGDAGAARKVGLRKKAVETFASIRNVGRGLALHTTIERMRGEHLDFHISPRSLRTWIRAFAEHGLNGLVEQKRGASGRPGVEVPAEFVALGKALVIERGSVAFAARELGSHPDLPASMRRFLHGAHCSKSYVTPSIARAITPAMLTQELVQGPKNARLAGRWTPCDYSNCRAGDYFVSDDMTSNVLCWTEWPNAQGWRLGQAQILPVMDVRSLRWLNVRAIVRDGNAYNAQDDIWGLFGDVFDTFGLPAEGFVLEGGTWQSDCIRGVRTGLDADIRIGGLESLGLQNVRSFDPRSKIIETMFDKLQHHMDRMPGFAGRDQRQDIGEAIKKRVGLLRVKNPQHHPREWFPHVSQLADNVRTAMENMNNEPQDGKLLRGMSPLEMWASHNPQLRCIPDEAKWIYRSAMNVSKITNNGVRIARGSGAKQEIFYYDNPSVLVPLQGRQVIVHWNDSNPDADAILRLPMPGSAPKFLCVAKRVQPLQRFTATPEQLSEEARRKNAALRYARTELRSIQPELVRSSRPIAVQVEAAEMGERIARAARGQGEPDAGGRYAPLDAGAPGSGLAGVPVEQRPKQIRGCSAAVRAAVQSFRGQAFTLRDVRAKLPDALKPRVSSVLCYMNMAGELSKSKSAGEKTRFQEGRSVRPKVPGASPKPGDIVDIGDGKKTYVLDPH